MLWTDIAYAMGTAPQGGQPAGPGGLIANIAPFVLMFAVFYFLLIRPQQKRAKEHRAMLSALKRGDKVVTSGGLHGTIVEAQDDVVVVGIPFALMESICEVLKTHYEGWDKFMRG